MDSLARVNLRFAGLYLLLRLWLEPPANCESWGIELTPVGAIWRGWGHEGGRPPKPCRVGSSILNRGGVPGVPAEASPARRLRMPAVWGRSAWTGKPSLLLCAARGFQSSLTADTIFQDTRKPLTLWRPPRGPADSSVTITTLPSASSPPSSGTLLMRRAMRLGRLSRPPPRFL